MRRTDGQLRAADDPGVARPAAGGLAARNVAATEHLNGGRLREAVEILEPLLADCRHLLGTGHPDTLIVEGNLAVAYVVAGHDDAGMRLMLANLAERERALGPEHLMTLTARDAVAAAHRRAGRLSEALWLYSQVAPQRNRILGPAHPDTLTTRLGLGLTFAAAGDTAMAVDVVSAALQDCERSGAENEHAAVLRSCLADLQCAASPPTAVPPQRSGPAPATRGLSVVRSGSGGRPTIDARRVSRRGVP